MSQNFTNFGLGSDDFMLAVYIANQPKMAEYQQLNQVQPLILGEISAIGEQCGNGWRKIFNVYAKLVFALKPEPHPLTGSFATWQQFRDSLLLQEHSATALMFSPPQLTQLPKAIHIISGRTYAQELVKTKQIPNHLEWLDSEFAIDRASRLIVCPYFDYRQLSNIKIERLSKLIESL